MKFLLFTAVSCLSFSVFSAQITKDDLVNLYKKNKSTLEKVEPGMTVEYRNNFTLESQKCATNEKSVIISTNYPNKYLVYERQEHIQDCGSLSKKGEVLERLYFEDKFNINLVKEAIKEADLQTIDLDGIYLSTVQNQVEDGVRVKYFETFDMTMPQFSSSISFKTKSENGDESSMILLKRGFTDPTSIDISKLPIEDSEEN